MQTVYKDYTKYYTGIILRKFGAWVRKIENEARNKFQKKTGIDDSANVRR